LAAAAQPGTKPAVARPAATPTIQLFGAAKIHHSSVVVAVVQAKHSGL